MRERTLKNFKLEAWIGMFLLFLLLVIFTLLCEFMMYFEMTPQLTGMSNIDVNLLHEPILGYVILGTIGAVGYSCLRMLKWSVWAARTLYSLALSETLMEVRGVG